jgi:succinate dehydrogenase / fumarate reductase flavoprotein subunit
VKIYLGIDAAEALIPVAPTCHYIMGGVPTDLEGRVLADGKSAVLPGLYAAGECACVSVHGANRLGTNSLVDLVVFGRRAGVDIARFARENSLAKLPEEAEASVALEIDRLLGSGGEERVGRIREEMQREMTLRCSVFRDKAGLLVALEKIRELKGRLANVGLTSRGKRFNFELEEAFEVENMLKAAEATVFAAVHREESRGAHYRSDFPQRNDKTWLRHSLVFPTDEGLKVDFKAVSVTRFAPKPRTY